MNSGIPSPEHEFGRPMHSNAYATECITFVEFTIAIRGSLRYTVAMQDKIGKAAWRYRRRSEVKHQHQRTGSRSNEAQVQEHRQGRRQGCQARAQG